MYTIPPWEFYGHTIGNIEEFSQCFCRFLRNYKKDLFSEHLLYKLENEETYSEQIFFLPFHRFCNVLRPIKWWKRCLRNVNQLDIRKFTIEPAQDGYAGLRKRQVLKCVTSNERLRKLNVRFTNKAKPRSVSVHRIQDQHQIDLVNMKSIKVEYTGKCYRNIFSLMDIFLQFHWLTSFTTKKSSHVKKELHWVYKEHGQPERLQSDNGGEFKRPLKDCCKSRKTKMVNCRPYNPKARGKVERSHRSLRQKTYYDLMQQKKTDVNWVKSLPDYIKCLNNEKKEELGWKSPFEFYYGRKSNKQLNDGKSSENFDIDIVSTKLPSQSEYLQQAKQTEDWRNAAKKADERMTRLMVEKRARKNIYKRYNPSENVFVRIGKKEEDLPKNIKYWQEP